MELSELDKAHQIQLQLVANVYKVAAVELEEIANDLRKMEGVKAVNVYCETAEDLAFHWPDDINVPTLEVECWRYSQWDSGIPEATYGLQRIGDGTTNENALLWIYAF